MQPSREVEAALTLIREALRDLRYGQVVIQVHDGSVVQIDRTEKMRPLETERRHPQK